MILRDVECFFALAEELHFGRAAASMFMAQSTLSEAIIRLERELGGELFSRTTRRVDLTPLGSAFLVDVRGAYDELTGAYVRARDRAQRDSREVRIGYTLDARTVLHVLVRAVEGAATEVMPVPIQMTSSGQLAAIRRGEVDAGICWADEAADDLTSVALDVGHMVAAVHEGSALVRDGCVTRERLEHEQLIRFARDHSPVLFDAFVPTSGQVEILGVDHGGGVDHLLARVLSGTVVGVLVDSTAQQHPVDGIVYLPIVDADPIVRRLVWSRANTKPLLRAFVDAAQHHYGAVLTA